MLRVLSVALVLVSTSMVHAVEHEDDFKKAVAASGPEYVALRDKLVKSAPDAFLKEKAASKDFWERVVAISVAGWKANGADYAKKIVDKTDVSRTGAELYIWSRTAQTITPADIPLAIEMLFKRSAGVIGHGSGMTAISGAAQFGKFEYTELMLDYLSLNPIPDVPTARLIAGSVSIFPPKIVTVDRLVSLIETVAKDKKGGPKVNEVLARAIPGIAVRIPPEKKNEIIESLVSEEKLMGTLGPQAALKIAGMLGGPVANEGIDKFLRESKTPEKEPWAFQLLRQSRDKSGTQMIVRYAKDKKLPKEGRVVAIDNLAGVKYSEEIAETLKALLEDSTEPDTVRAEALRSIDQIARIHQNNAEISGPLRAAIAATSFEPAADSPLKKSVDFIKNGVQQ